MFNLNDSLHYLLYNRPTDMRTVTSKKRKVVKMLTEKTQ